MKFKLYHASHSRYDGRGDELSAPTWSYKNTKFYNKYINRWTADGWQITPIPHSTWFEEYALNILYSKEDRVYMEQI